MHGPSGPRRGSALGELGIVPDGALLIRNGVIEEHGPSRRVENLALARKAREIDASGRIVMPAFIDADTALAYPRFATRATGAMPRETPLRVLSKHTLEAALASAAIDCVRYGILTVGAHTGHALDLRDTMKILRIQSTLQGKPLRIRSILSPRGKTSLPEKWFQTVRRGKLALLMDVETTSSALDIALQAAHHNLSIRLRSAAPLTAAEIQLASEAGAVAILAPVPCPDTPAVHVIDATREMSSPHSLRNEVDAGIAIALSSGYNPGAYSSQSPQFLIQFAVNHLGLTPAEGITALTHNAACSLRVSQAAGSLDPGKAADIVIMDAPDYRDLIRRAGHNDVAAVMRAGRVVYRRSGLMLE